MRRDTLVSVVLVSVAAIALVLVGCQRYELDPVVPKALGSKTETHQISGTRTAPYVMLVVDRSGSMNDATTGSSTKWRDLVSSFTSSNGFLMKYGASMSFGLILFASGDSCNPGTVVSPVGTSVDQIIQQINAASPGGSTPTAQSLGVVPSDPKMATPEAGRDRYVMLLTDGAPNCNPNLDPANCVSTDSRPPTALTCLDDAATIAQVAALAGQGIKTFVIGFGKDTVDSTKPTYQTLDGAAVAGGTSRPQEPKFYQVNTADELATALGAIGGLIGTCNYVLSPAPANANLIEVVFVYTQAGNREEQLTLNSDFSYDASTSRLTIEGSRCGEILGGTAGLDVQFRYVTSL